MHFIHIGSSENSNNKNRLDTRLYELFNKIKKMEIHEQGNCLKLLMNLFRLFLYSMTSPKYHLMIF